MARPVYSVQLVDQQMTGNELDIITLPTTNTYVIRDITWTMQTPPSTGATLALYNDTMLIWSTSLPSSTEAGDTTELRWVAPGPLDLRVALVGPSATAYIHVSGYELTP